MKVLIIGAGTGGLALAHLLKGAGISVAVYERDRAPNADIGGYRVGISPAGSRALKACVPDELYDLYVATCARSPRYFNMLTEQLGEVLSFDIEDAGPNALDGERNVIRKTLRRVLLRGLEAEVFFGKTFQAYTNNADGSVTARFQDGSLATGDVLVGADGTSSTLRKQRLPEARLEDTGIVSLGGKIPMTAETKALLSDKMFKGMSLIMAPMGFGAIIHSLEFAHGRNDPSFAARWPDFVEALDEDSIGWGIWGARQNLPQDPAGLSGEQLRELGLEIARDWHPHLRAIIRMTEPATIHDVKMRTSVPLTPWTSSNVTLLGDAVHTMTPGRGAGANTALRDAALFGRMLIEADQGRKSLLEAIRAYEIEMLRYSSEAVRESKKQMDAGDLAHRPIIGRLQLGVARGVMRTVNAIPALRRRTFRQMMRVRGEN